MTPPVTKNSRTGRGCRIAGFVDIRRGYVAAVDTYVGVPKYRQLSFKPRFGVSEPVSVSAKRSATRLDASYSSAACPQKKLSRLLF